MIRGFPIVAVVLALLLFGEGALAAGKQELTDRDLAQVTASGEPKENTAAVIPREEAALSRVTLQSGAQSNINGLAVNNVAGANLVANGINLGGGASLTGK
jgi:hypothetical protein